MDVVENFKQAAEAATNSEASATKRGIREFLKALFGPSDEPLEATSSLTFDGSFFPDGKPRVTRGFVAEIIASLVTDLAVARRTLHYTRLECNAELEKRRAYQQAFINANEAVSTSQAQIRERDARIQALILERIKRGQRIEELLDLNGQILGGIEPLVKSIQELVSEWQCEREALLRQLKPSKPGGKRERLRELRRNLLAMSKWFDPHQRAHQRLLELAEKAKD
jgi:urease gamma subunit